MITIDKEDLISKWEPIWGQVMDWHDGLNNKITDQLGKHFQRHYSDKFTEQLRTTLWIQIRSQIEDNSRDNHQ